MKSILYAAFAALIFASCTPTNITYEIELGKVPATAVYKNDDPAMWSVWGASMVKGEDGLYHIFYSRWRKNLGWSWVVDSEIAHATSASPYGPWKFKDITLPRRGKEHWDGWCTHNPTIHKFNGKYYLYYMGNTGDGVMAGTPTKERLNWTHRNNQRIGVAVADSPNGPWTRFDKPVIDVTNDDSAPDCLMTSNPSVTMMKDGKILMIYKAVGKQFKLPGGGPVVHLAATADSPTGPFTKHEGLVFNYEGERFPAEDPYIWYADGKYHAIVKRMSSPKMKECTLMQFESMDGFDWAEAPEPYNLVSTLKINWEDGNVTPVTHLERPQLYIENGEPLLLLCAADTTDVRGVRHCFNVQIPVNITKHNLER